MKRTLPLASLALLSALPMAAHAEATLYGQVNKGLFGYDDGLHTDLFVGDNSYSSTRFGFKNSTLLDNGLTASVLLEDEILGEPTNTVTQNTTTGQNSGPVDTAATFNQRQARVGLSSRTFGSAYLGFQSTAIDGILTQDLTGAQDVMTADYRKLGGGLKFASGNTYSAITTSGETSDIATKRVNAVRYDSPFIGPVQMRASYAQNGDTELAATYMGSIAGLRAKAGAGVEFNNDLTSAVTNQAAQVRRYSASASVAHKSGLAATLAYSASDLQNEATNAKSPYEWYAKVGYAWGQDNAYEVAADYGQANHYGSSTVNTDRLKAWGLAAEYNIIDGVSLAALYRSFDVDRTATATDSMDLYGVNMRVKF